MRELEALARELGMACWSKCTTRRSSSARSRSTTPLIGINNRNLRTLRDAARDDARPRCRASRRTACRSPKAASSARATSRDARRGVHCFLVGEAFMRAADPGGGARARLVRAGRRPAMIPDQLSITASLRRALRTVFAPAQLDAADAGRDRRRGRARPPTQRAHAAALMRVNHTGEICAQALYQGQALTARNPQREAALGAAARGGNRAPGVDRAAASRSWAGGRACSIRSGTRDRSRSARWPAWLGDRWNLGFLAETERQVVEHLEGHLQRACRRMTRRAARC